MRSSVDWFELAQRESGWQFDLSSALIGAVFAWILAIVIYSQRHKIRELGESLWQPFSAWRRRAQASREEKYIQALKQILRPLLLLEPSDPEAIFQPPEFRAPAPLPTSVAEAAQTPRTMIVPYASLLTGHDKLIISGPPASGRTTTLVMTAWHVTEAPSNEEDLRPYKRLPIWIDLRTLRSADPRAKASASERLVELATRTMPDLLPKWVLQHLRKEPCLILLDNWEDLPPDLRIEVAGWIQEASEKFPDVFWMITTGQEGYGSLVELGFVPTELLGTLREGGVDHLYEGWTTLLGPKDEKITAADAAPADAAMADADQEHGASSGNDVSEHPQTKADALARLLDAVTAGAPLWELHLRTVLYLKTGFLPERPAEVLDGFIDMRFDAVDLGRGLESVPEDARVGARRALMAIARAERLGGRAPNNQELKQSIDIAMPPKEDRPRRLESQVRRLVAGCRLLRKEDGRWYLNHRIWRDYFTALALSEDDQGADIVAAHLEDPDWSLLIELYAGVAEIDALVQALVSRSEIYSDRESLLRAARWAIVAEPDRAWRKDLMKVLAQTFMHEDLAWSLRLDIGRALTLIAGESARAFFLRMVRHPSKDIQGASLRGLGWLGASRDVPILAAALQDSAVELRQSAIRALADVGTSEAIHYLGHGLATTDETSMRLAAELLAITPQGWPMLEEATQHPDLLVRRAAAYGLGHVDQAWVRDILMTMASEDPEWVVRSAAEIALSAREERKVETVTIPSPPDVENLDWLIAWAARQGMGLGVGQAALDTLRRAAQEGNIDAKILSALTLAQVGREADQSVLEPLRTAQDGVVRQTADWAIRRIRQRYHVYQGAS
ncbi:MAG: NACHT domain-containing protein [Anaerolineae bacterium]